MNLIKLIQKWITDKSAVAAVEAAFVFPVLLIIFAGIIDIANGILANQKLVSASSTVSSIITRNSTITLTQVNDAISAADLIMQPYSNTGQINVHIESYSYDGAAIPNITQVWEVANSSYRNSGTDVTDSLAALAVPNEGVVVVGVNYTYTPFFLGSAIGSILAPLDMTEISYARGRLSPVVTCSSC